MKVFVSEARSSKTMMEDSQGFRMGFLTDPSWRNLVVVRVFLGADLWVQLDKIMELCLIIVCVEMVLEDFGMFWPTIERLRQTEGPLAAAFPYDSRSSRVRRKSWMEKNGNHSRCIVGEGVWDPVGISRLLVKLP